MEARENIPLLSVVAAHKGTSPSIHGENITQGMSQAMGSATKALFCLL